MRRLLFSKWFFGLLAIVLLLDMISDLAEHLHPQYYQFLNYVALVLDVAALILVLWMFVDLSRRRPADGNDPRR